MNVHVIRIASEFATKMTEPWNGLKLVYSDHSHFLCYPAHILCGCKLTVNEGQSKDGEKERTG